MNAKNETFYEFKYAVYHKPTEKWILIENHDLELTATILTLVDFKHSTISKNKGYLESVIRSSYFNKTPNYGNENFLEFELVKIKTTYTIES